MELCRKWVSVPSDPLAAIPPPPAHGNHMSSLFLGNWFWVVVVFCSFFSFRFHMYVRSYEFVFLCLVSLRIRPARSSMLSQMARFPFLRLNNIPWWAGTHEYVCKCVCGTTSSTHLCMDLGCFRVLAVINWWFNFNDSRTSLLVCDPAYPINFHYFFFSFLVVYSVLSNFLT